MGVLYGLLRGTLGVWTIVYMSKNHPQEEALQLSKRASLRDGW